ncbi:MAG TPA: multiheme c-type cytochrome [Chthoniobacterales bacterium]|nr:multiheme c-type cytochrome [Chthoniobacterales bacterium]
MSLRAASICLLLLGIAVRGSAKEPRQVRETRDTFVGSVGCKSSSCHGGAGPKRSQYFTWSQKDYHTKAYVVLLNSRSERIAEGLGLPSAQTSARCTVCHSPFQAVAPSRLASSPPDEGVSCESCHGAAGGWLRGHTRLDWTYNTRVGAGMRDLRNLYVRATACAACHQNLAPDLLKAGHPDLFFELDSQSIAEPKHWKDEEPWSGLREWLTGQAVALREMSWALASDPPDEASTARWNGLAWLCATTTSAASLSSPISQPSGGPSGSDFGRMQSEADALARRASVSNWSDSSARSLLFALASLDAEFTAKGVANQVLGQRAKRLVLALDRLTYALNKNAGFHPKIESELNQLFQDVKSLDAFEAGSFVTHLQAFRAALEKSG